MFNSKLVFINIYVFNTINEGFILHISYIIFYFLLFILSSLVYFIYIFFQIFDNETYRKDTLIEDLFKINSLPQDCHFQGEPLSVYL